MSRRYTVVVQREEDGSGYYVTVPALPGCFSAGPTEEQALTNVAEAVQAHIEGLAKSGQPIPGGAREGRIGGSGQFYETNRCHACADRHRGDIWGIAEEHLCDKCIVERFRLPTERPTDGGNASTASSSGDASKAANGSTHRGNPYIKRGGEICEDCGVDMVVADREPCKERGTGNARIGREEVIYATMSYYNAIMNYYKKQVGHETLPSPRSCLSSSLVCGPVFGAYGWVR